MSYKIQKKIAKLSSKHSRIFFLLAIIAVILSKVFSFSETSFITIFCFFLISTLGVSHGSLDNFKGKKLLKTYKIKNQFIFFLLYILISFVVILAWLLSPSLILFFFFSCQVISMLLMNMKSQISYIYSYICPYF